MPIVILDRCGIKLKKDSKRVYTDEGFLRVPGFAARTGVQEYLACELGLKDCDPDSIVRVMRPESEVFSDESLSSYAGADVTLYHPESKAVTAEDYKTLSKGVVLNARRDGDFVAVDMIIKDADTIKAVESGITQLSAGYSSVIEPAPTDADYDFIQKDILINHLAIVPAARAGAQARIADGEKTMPVLTVIDGKPVDVADAANAQLVVDTIAALTKKAEDAEQASKAIIDAKDEKIASLESKVLTDAQVTEKVAAVMKVHADAAKVAGKDFVCDSASVPEIKRAALKVRRSAIDWASKPDAYVDAAFDMALEEPSNTEQLRQLANDGAVLIDAKPEEVVKSRSQMALEAQIKGAK